MLASVVSLHAQLSSRPLAMSCLAARAADTAATKVLCATHHEWMAWTTAAMVSAEAADDEELLVWWRLALKQPPARSLPYPFHPAPGAHTAPSLGPLRSRHCSRSTYCHPRRACARLPATLLTACVCVRQVAAYRKREAALVPGRAEDADVFIRLNHALIIGLETAEAAAVLREAYALDRASSGVGAEGWIARWVPEDLDIADDVRRILDGVEPAVRLE